MKGYKKVICSAKHSHRVSISKHKWYDLTIGQTYNVTEHKPMNPDKTSKLVLSTLTEWVYRTDNNKYYPMELFITIEQYREQQLNKIL